MPPASSQPNLALTVRPSPRFWVLLVAVSLLTGLAAGLLMRLLRAVQHLAYGYRSGDFLAAAARAPALRLLAALLAAGVLIGLVRRWLRVHGGGHAGEVNEAIWRDDGRMSVLRTTANAVLSIVGVGLGVALGREGAPKQMGGAAASLLADWTRLDAPQRRLLAACGAGAGMAAVYDVPLGGALFTLEILLGSFALPYVLPALAASAIATATAWLLLAHRVVYDLRFTAPPSVALLGVAALSGPLFGVAAAFYIRAIAWANARTPRGLAQLAAPVLVLAVLGLFALRYPELLGNGRGVVAEALTGVLPLAVLAALLPLRVLATTACLASGAPGGLFTPTLAIGALLGGLLGHLVPGIPPATAALLGAAAFLAAATQGPVSSLALLLEMVARITPQLVPLMLAIAGATVVSRALEARSIYSARLPP